MSLSLVAVKRVSPLMIMPCAQRRCFLSLRRIPCSTSSDVENIVSLRSQELCIRLFCSFLALVKSSTILATQGCLGVSPLSSLHSYHSLKIL